MSNDSFEPWYMKVANEPNQKKREELIQGAFGFSPKEKSSHSGLSSFLTGTSIMYALGALFFGARAKKNQEKKSIVENNNNFLEEELKYLNDGFKNIDFTKEIHGLIGTLENTIGPAKDSITRLEEKMSTPDFAEIIDIAPREYKVALNKQIGLYFDYISNVELVIDNIRSNRWKAEDIEALISDVTALGENYKEVESFADKADQVINDWLKKNEDNQEGKRVKKLLNKLQL